MKGEYLSITGFMKNGLLKKIPTPSPNWHLKMLLLQKENLARRSSSCKRNGGSQLVGRQPTNGPNSSYHPSKKVYIFYFQPSKIGRLIMFTLKMFQDTSNLTTLADPDRLLAPKEYLII